MDGGKELTVGVNQDCFRKDMLKQYQEEWGTTTTTKVVNQWIWHLQLLTKQETMIGTTIGMMMKTVRHRLQQETSGLQSFLLQPDSIQD